MERDRVFHVQKFLGRGTFGTVWKAVWKTNSVSFPVAIKRVRTDKCSTYHECVIIESLHHPNIIKCMSSSCKGRFPSFCSKFPKNGVCKLELTRYETLYSTSQILQFQRSWYWAFSTSKQGRR